MSQANPFVVSPLYTAIALAYQPKSFIADMVMPRLKVESDTYKYDYWGPEQMATLPRNARIGRYGQPEEVQFAGEERTGTTQDYGLIGLVSQDDVNKYAKQKGVDLNAINVNGTLNIMSSLREKRVADLVFNAATYPVGNKIALTGGQRYDQFATSDPLSDILTALDVPWNRPNTMVLGRDVATKLRQHPKVLAAYSPSGGNAAVGGMVPLEALKTLFDLDNVLVGDGRINVAREGQAPSFVRAWGKSIALLHIMPASQSGGVKPTAPTFGWTAVYEDRFVQQEYSAMQGVKGVWRNKVVDRLGEQIVAANLGYYIETAVN